ncbi:MAG TPA: hypothetical protein VI603_03480 [Saprospiraceae bacterium]|nr:hypothetical protein [Saprospiraceae bacterium]
MRKPMVLIGLFALVISGLRAQTDYVQWVVVDLTPKADKIGMFEAGLAAHNKKYHTADPYKAYVWAVNTGPGSGSYTWVMGPISFAQMDARPVNAEHDTDWNNNVVAHCESVAEISYWRWDEELSYAPEGAQNFTKSRIRFSTILPGEGDRYEEQVKKIVEVYKQKKYPAAYNVYWRYGASEGPHAAIGMDFANWAYLDTPNTFVEDFESIHGDGSWQRFLEELDLCIDRSKTYDELTEFMPGLSSPN